MKPLSVRSLGVRLSGRDVLSGVTFDVGKSELVALIGTNGSGKTTLLRATVGLQPHQGEVLLGGVRPGRLRQRSAALSWLPDDAVPPAELTVQAQLELGRRLGGATAARSAELSKLLDLDALALARCGELSRGEGRRVLLHGVFCAGRPLLVLDEPLSTFDPVQLRGVLAVLRELAARGAGVLLSVHQLSDAERIADRIVVLHRGRVLASGTLEALRGQVALPGAGLEQVYLALVERLEAAPAPA